ncbi:MAG: pirin family protein [bacterium]|nr:pirin family protein [bacterium]
MIALRRSEERGHANHGWLESYHTFSFAGYDDPRYRGFSSLRVMNEDRVAPGQGFGTHPHRDMEIVSYVLEGALEHKDSMGNGEVLRPGEFQRISAGTGISHSEFNPDDSATTHFYQIWLFPDRKGLPPSYEQKSFDVGGRDNRLQLVASPDGADGSLKIHQDARIYLANLQDSQQLDLPLDAKRAAWLQVLRGSVALNEHDLFAGDGAAIREESQIRLVGKGPVEVMLFDLA